MCSSDLYLIFGFAFAVVLVYLVISNFSDNAKIKNAAAYKEVNAPAPDFPIPISNQTNQVIEIKNEAKR